MTKQLFFEDVAVGDDLPDLVKHPSPRQLVQWANASGDYFEIHYDKEFARGQQGLPNVIVHGDLTAAFLVHLVTRWMGDLGMFKKIHTTNHAMLFPGEDILCRGKVVRKYTEGEQLLIECDVSAENPRGSKCVTGVAVVALPSKTK